MDFLDIPGLNIAQESGGMGWNPANGVPFCARAYICRQGTRKQPVFPQHKTKRACFSEPKNKRGFLVLFSLRHGAFGGWGVPWRRAL